MTSVLKRLSGGKWRPIILGFLIGPLVVICGGLIWLVAVPWTDHVPQKPFSAERWLQGDRRIRGEMADDLVNSGILVGKTREEVLELLGKDDYAKSAQDRIWTYTVDMGEWLFFGRSMNYLYVIFDRSSNRARDVYVTD